MKNQTNIMRFFAISSVITAHSNRGELIELFNFPKISILFNNFGIYGVSIFFFMAGIFYYKDKSLFKEFTIKKMKNIFIPWIFTGTLVYAYIIIRKGGMSFSSYFNFLVGNGSYLYFLTLLFIYYFCLWKLKKYKSLIIILILFSILYRLVPLDNVFQINRYLNPIYFLPFFLSGMLVEKYDIFQLIVKTLGNYYVLIIILNILIHALFIYYDFRLSYWEINSFFYQINGVLLALSLTKIRFLYRNFIQDIGDNSFAIYLLHMPFVGLTFWIVHSITVPTYLIIFLPFFILAVTQIFISTYIYVAIRLNIRFPLSLIGVKAEVNLSM